MTKRDEQALKYLAELYGAKTPFEIYRVAEKLARKAQRGSQIAAGQRAASPGASECESEAEANLDRGQ